MTHSAYLPHFSNMTQHSFYLWSLVQASRPYLRPLIPQVVLGVILTKYSFPTQDQSVSDVRTQACVGCTPTPDIQVHRNFCYPEGISGVSQSRWQYFTDEWKLNVKHCAHWIQGSPKALQNDCKQKCILCPCSSHSWSSPILASSSLFLIASLRPTFLKTCFYFPSIFLVNSQTSEEVSPISNGKHPLSNLDSITCHTLASSCRLLTLWFSALACTLEFSGELLKNTTMPSLIIRELQIKLQ
jgi:hypothetical protein